MVRHVVASLMLRLGQGPAGVGLSPHNCEDSPKALPVLT
jgi:hypothetical protein